jgi:hypothetical protein
MEPGPNRWQSIALFDAPQVAFLAVAVATASAASDPQSARESVAWLTGCVAVALGIGHFAQSRLARQIVVATIVAAASIGALYFVTQFSSLAVPDKIPQLEAIGRFVSAPWPRAIIWAPFPNSLATLLEGLFLLAVGAAADARRAVARLLFGLAVAIVGLALLLTMSRGAWLAVACGAVVWVVVATFPRRPRFVVPIAALLTLLAIGIAMTWQPGLAFFERTAALAGDALIRPDRIDIYRKSISLLDDVGVAGLGPGGQFALPYARFALVIQVPFVTYPHHLTFHVWLAYGIAGIIAMTWMVGGVAAAVATAERQQVSGTFRGAWCGLVAVLVHGLSDARQAVDVWTWATFFLLSALVAARHRQTGNRLARSVIGSLCAALVIVLVIGAARFWPVEAAWHTRQGLIAEAQAAAPGLARTPLDLEKAAAMEYAHAIDVDARNAGARRRLALISADRGDFAAAFAHATAALQADPDGYATRKIAGLVATWAGHLEIANALLRPIPGVTDELQTWAAAWRDRGQGDAAVYCTRLASQLSGTGER